MRITVYRQEASTVEIQIIWRCQCTHTKRSHVASVRNCAQCKCEKFRVRTYNEAYLRELSDHDHEPRISASDSQLLSELLARIEVMRLATGGWDRPGPGDLIIARATYAHDPGLPRMLTAVRADFHAADAVPEPPALASGEVLIAAARLGPSPALLDVAGHRGSELFGVDIDGRRHFICRCACCNARRTEVCTDAELSRRDPADPLRSRRADALAQSLADHLRGPVPPADQGQPTAEAVAA